MLQTWLYRSTAIVPARSTAEGLIYLQSRSANRSGGLTGYLHREGSIYVQYLEGPERPLRALECRIRRDWRHRAVETLIDAPTAARRFEGWDMAFTEDETATFGAWQGGGDAAVIGGASGEQLLRFMTSATAGGRAGSLADRLPSWVD